LQGRQQAEERSTNQRQQNRERRDAQVEAGPVEKWNSRRRKTNKNAIPAAAPISERRAASVSVCRINRPRLAPSAERTASSRSRPSPRTIIRLATFAQAISSTAKTEPSRIQAIVRESCVSLSRSERMLK